MVLNDLYIENSQNKVSRLFPLDHGSKAPSQDIKMKKKFLIYNIYLSGIQRN